jgi:hypothetical protein
VIFSKGAKYFQAGIVPMPLLGYGAGLLIYIDGLNIEY